MRQDGEEMFDIGEPGLAESQGIQEWIEIPKSKGRRSTEIVLRMLNEVAIEWY